MYESNYSTDKQILTNGDSKLSKNQFSKSLTSFHTKKNISKNISSQNPPKKSGLIKQDKSVKNKRVYLSSKKAKALNYLQLNLISPQNNFINDLNKQEIDENKKKKIYNAPSSVQRSYKYQNCYILNNLNNYQSNVIQGDLLKTNNNKYTDNKLSDSIEKYNDNEIIIDNNSKNHSYNNNENDKTNGASSNINENNSLIQPSINGLNTITFNINNNFNNCYNNYNTNNNTNKNIDYIQFNGFMNINGYEGNNKSVRNSNDHIIFDARDKILNKLEESDKDNYKNMIINIETDNKVINNKRSALLKDRSKNKSKSKPNFFSNASVTCSVPNLNQDNIKKSQKTSNYNEKNDIYDINRKYIYETMDNIIRNDENNFMRTKNIYKFNNKKNNFNNNRNSNNKNSEIEITKSLNNLESAKKNQVEKENTNIANVKTKDNIKTSNEQYQTYMGSFRNSNKMIKVNMIDNKKSQNDEGNLYNNTQNVNPQKIGFKNNDKSSNNLKSYVDKNENKSLYGCKRYNKKNNSKSNKNINIINNNKSKYSDKNKNNKNILIQTYNNLKKEKGENENIKQKEGINHNNYNEPNYNNELQTKSVNSLNCYSKKSNIIPLTRENSITYIRKKSLNMKVYNNTNNDNKSSRPSAIKHKKNYSISSSCYNTQRYLNEPKIDSKNKSIKKGNIYPSKNEGNIINANEEKTIVIPEYKIKLENIKSRINNLLNIYSLLALRSLKNPSIELNNNRENIKNFDNKEEEY